MRERIRLWLSGWLGIARLNDAVSFLLLRDLNVMSAAPKGSDGHAALRDAFLHLLPILKPDIVCDIGAFDGALSLAVRQAAPGCEIHAFEAHPQTHAHCAEKLAAKNIACHHLAVSDTVGRLTLHAPRGQHAGKASLLRRREEVSYDSFEVEACTLDNHFSDRLNAEGPSFFLWIDVEGAAERVLRGAPEVIERTLAVFVECETHPFWQDGSSAGGVADLLLREGFVPLARDREYGDKQFNVLFVAGSVTHRLAPSLFDAGSPLRRCLALHEKPVSRVGEE